MSNDYIPSPSSNKLPDYIFIKDEEHCKRYNHNWVKFYPAEGKAYTKCSACGKIKT